MIRVGQYAMRYRLPISLAPQRERLDTIGRAVMGDGLEQALARHGISSEDNEEEICIREIQVPVQLKLSKNDATLAAGWSLALGEAIARIVKLGMVDSVVRYRSRTHAALDMAVGIASGRLERVWAWKQIGLWSGTAVADEHSAIEELMGALEHDPSFIQPVVSMLAREHLLTRFANRLSSHHWKALAVAALDTVRLSEIWMGWREGEQTVSADVRRRAGSMMGSSCLTEECRTMGELIQRSSEARWAMAVLITLETERGCLCWNGKHGTELLAAVEQQLRQVVDDTSTAQSRAPKTETRRGEPRKPATAHQADAPSPKDCRVSSTTDYGGLLFLLGVLEDSGVLQDMLHHPAMMGRPFRWMLQSLAMALVQTQPDDPAVGVFSGMGLGSENAWEDEGPLTEEESVAIHTWVAWVADHLQRRMGMVDVPENELMAFVCRRPAEIVSDPGWVEVTFALREVSTEIRRAALDLDPGYIPWLGTVLRFRYE